MDIIDKLSQPFEADEVKFKPQTVRGNRALAVCFIDARCVMERLDEVLGVGCWQDSYQVLPNNSVVCTLRLKIDGEWISKSDVGSPSEQPDEGDRVKSSFSDALKRAAVKVGIGRYLYRLPLQWVDYDPDKRQFKNTPRLPEWAIPKPQPAAPAVPAVQPGMDVVQKWNAWLDTDPNLEAINAKLPEIGSLAPAVKSVVWGSVQQRMTAARYVFDKSSKKFFAAQPQGAA